MELVWDCQVDMLEMAMSVRLKVIMLELELDCLCYTLVTASDFSVDGCDLSQTALRSNNNMCWTVLQLVAAWAFPVSSLELSSETASVFQSVIARVQGSATRQRTLESKLVGMMETPWDFLKALESDYQPRTWETMSEVLWVWPRVRSLDEE